MIVARRGASLAAERSPSGARADGARRSQTARAWPRAAQHKLMACFKELNLYLHHCWSMVGGLWFGASFHVNVNF